jgi:hypothetical protein
MEASESTRLARETCKNHCCNCCWSEPCAWALGLFSFALLLMIPFALGFALRAYWMSLGVGLVAAIVAMCSLVLCIIAGSFSA